jgi:hypothetical protein
MSEELINGTAILWKIWTVRCANIIRERNAAVNWKNAAAMTRN